MKLLPKSRRGRVALGCGLAAGLLAGAWLALRLAPRDPMAVAFDRVEVGMTPAEAEAAVGRGPEMTSEGDWPPPRREEPAFALWMRDGSQLVVELRGGRVVGKRYDPGPNPLERSLRWLSHRLGW